MMMRRTIAMILAVAVGAATGGTALAGPHTDPDQDTAPPGGEDLSRHISTVTPVTDGEPSGRPHVIVVGHDIDVGGDTVCMNTTELGPCGGSLDTTGRQVREPMSRTPPE
jgi:hypothetical protein